MRPLIFLLPLVFIALPASSADLGKECKRYKVKTDPITGESELEVKIEGSWSRDTRLVVEGTRVELRLSVRTGGAYEGEVPVGLILPFLFDGSRKVDFITTRPQQVKAFALDGGVMTRFYFNLGLDASRLGMLATASPTLIRVPLPSGDYDWRFNKQEGKIFNKVASCIQKLVPEPTVQISESSILEAEDGNADSPNSEPSDTSVTEPTPHDRSDD